MAALVRKSLKLHNIFTEFSNIYLTRRCTIVRVGSFVMLARSCATLGQATPSLDVHNQCKKVEMKQLETKFGWIRSRVPCFSMNGDNIRVITEPADFYETFKGMAVKARRRIVIASLYLGTGEHEKELVTSIEEACERAIGNEDFEVHILLDYTRGSRGGSISSRTMLLPLLQKYGDRVNIYLYHTPDLRGLLKRYIPERFNETVGLTHMKIYLVDNDVIISGANLSESYFTNRQDRYIQFCDCPEMTNYLTDIVKSMSDFTFHLQSDNSTTYPQQSPHPYEGSDTSSVFKSYAGDIVNKVKHSVMQKQTRDITLGEITCDNSDHDTWLCPLVQMGPFGIYDDESVTKELFERTESRDKIFLASGYFNLTSQYMDTIINDSEGQFEILTASPQEVSKYYYMADEGWRVISARNRDIFPKVFRPKADIEANGFYGASGVSGFVPTAYTDIAQKFYTQVCGQCQDQRISIYEYFRDQWTFHAKGLWYYLPNSSLPVMTFIGSPNFGYRSVYRDLECQVVVMTTNKDLQNQLKQEHTRLYEGSTKVTEETFQQPDRYIPLWVKLVTKFMRNFF